MKFVVASDHAGVDMKDFIADFLKNKNFDVVDLGTNGTTSVDYPVYADKLANYILSNNDVLGILVCGTGVGISIRANRYKGIRAAILYSDEVAEMVKKHNNANVMVFGGRTMSKEDITRRIDIFLNTEYKGGRHQRRIDMLDL
ncbi:MAG: ribose 5-phosphate isomerase B [Alphaproteobacteria bacterium]|nr:ribose 5-phosphate isomerase B [Alphaproteobacteria bacterium]